MLIQKHVRILVQKMNEFRRRLHAIRLNLLQISLKIHLRLYIKKRRIGKGELRPHILELAKRNKIATLKIQNFIRTKVLGRGIRKFKLAYRQECLKQRIKGEIFFRGFINKLTRDKETYWV